MAWRWPPSAPAPFFPPRSAPPALPLRSLSAHRHTGDEGSAVTSEALATGASRPAARSGILIPPSSIFIIYGILTQNSIVNLFMAGMVPESFSLY